MDRQIQARTAPRAGVYVHFPYCLAKCPYCDFVSYVPPEGRAIDHAGYADAVIRELDDRACFFEDRSIESVFFGGGTPSLWDPRQLGRVLEAIRATLPSAPGKDVEVTVECNPTSLDEDRARALVDVGVGRVSIGVQSLRDEHLRFLGRLHDARGGIAAIGGAMRAGVPRVSGDLIFGLPGQTPEQARDEALELADLGLAHLSAYQLTIEPGTRFGELARRGRLPLAQDGAVADAFLAVDEGLQTRGLGHYEVSNYARPGEEARHNLGYWRGDEYLGLGCAAYGFTRTRGGEGAARGERWRNEPLAERYVAREAIPSATREELDAETMLRERIMLGLRTSEGVDLDEAASDLGISGRGWTDERERAATRLEERGRVERVRVDGGRLRLRIPRAAWLWTDDTAARLM